MSAAEKLDIEVEYLAAMEGERKALDALVDSPAPTQEQKDTYRRAQRHRLDVYRRRDHRVIAREEATKLEQAKTARDSA